MKTYVPLAKPSHFYICGINMFESLLFHGFTQKIIQKILAVSINIKKNLSVLPAKFLEKFKLTLAP